MSIFYWKDGRFENSSQIDAEMIEVFVILLLLWEVTQTNT